MRVIVTDHDLGVMDEAVQALFRAGCNVQAVALGAVTLRLRGQREPVVVPLRADEAPLPANVVGAARVLAEGRSMSVRIAWDPEENVACLYDSTSGVAFGQIFDGDESYEDAERFLDWLARKGLDARAVQPNTLRDLRAEFATRVAA